VPEFSAIAAPLHALTQKGRAFVWTSECQEAFDELKTRLTSSPVLALPKNGCRYIIDTDASDHGIGAVLQQEQDREERVLRMPAGCIRMRRNAIVSLARNSWPLCISLCIFDNICLALNFL